MVLTQGLEPCLPVIQTSTALCSPETPLTLLSGRWYRRFNERKGAYQPVTMWRIHPPASSPLRGAHGRVIGAAYAGCEFLVHMYLRCTGHRTRMLTLQLRHTLPVVVLCVQDSVMLTRAYWLSFFHMPIPTSGTILGFVQCATSVQGFVQKNQLELTPTVMPVLLLLLLPAQALQSSGLPVAQAGASV